MLSDGATVSVSLKSSTSRSSMKSSESEPESESSCLLVACDLESRPKMLSTMEAALDATLEGAFGADEGGGDGARLWLLPLALECELCLEEAWLLCEDLALDAMLPSLFLRSTCSGTKDEMSELGAALYAFETVLLALSTVNSSGLVLER